MSAGCPICGYDSEEKILASWKIFIPMETPSQNVVAKNTAVRLKTGLYRDVRGKLYRQTRDDFRLLLRNQMHLKAIPPAYAKRRLIVNRIYSGRGQRYDRANLIGGAKALVDALVLERFLVADNEDYLDDHYRQEKRDSLRGVEITIQEIAWKDRS